MGSDQHTDVRRRTHSACKSASLEQQGILGTEAHVKAVLPVPWPLLRLTAHEVKGLADIVKLTAPSPRPSSR